MGTKPQKLIVPEMAAIEVSKVLNDALIALGDMKYNILKHYRLNYPSGAYAALIYKCEARLIDASNTVSQLIRREMLDKHIYEDLPWQTKEEEDQNEN